MNYAWAEAAEEKIEDTAAWAKYRITKRKEVLQTRKLASKHRTNARRNDFFCFPLLLSIEFLKRRDTKKKNQQDSRNSVSLK